MPTLRLRRNINYTMTRQDVYLEPNLQLGHSDSHRLDNCGWVWARPVLEKDNLQYCYDVIGFTEDSYILSGVLQDYGCVDLMP